jgi:hypothetical protein
VFDRFDVLARLYDRLPTEFTASDLGRPGLTDGRRHVVLRHFCEHPAFDCTLVARQPLTARKHDPGPRTDTMRADCGENTDDGRPDSVPDRRCGSR